MKKRLAILYSVLVFGFSTVLQGQSVEAYSAIDSSSITIGDHVNMEIGINIPKGFDVQWPILIDTLSSHIEILKSSEPDTLFENDQLTIKQQLLLTSFDSGFFEVPSITFNFKHREDTTLYSTKTNKLFLQVYTPAVDTSQAFKVIKGPVSEPYTFREILPWILIVLAVTLVAILLIWYLRKRRKNQPVFAKKAKPLPPPHITAIKKLEELRLAKIWQQGRMKLYYTELIDITREYMEGRFHFDALEMTTDEIINTISERNVNKEVLNKLGASMQLADLVKFAKGQPTALENDMSLNNCMDFVNETKETTAISSEGDVSIEQKMEENK